MATTAALLQIQVAAETTKAALALRKLDKQLVGIDKTTATATTRTSNLGKASSKAGATMRRAAGAAASAALAYVSISQAKAAVTTTQDLAKTTAGLSRNLGLSSKQASRWGTVAKARDIDAKALTMSFTTLSRRITDMSKGSESAVDSFKDIGVSQKEMKKTGGDFNQQLLLVADAFGAAEGGAVRQQAAQKLLGRGYQTLLPMFSEGSKSLKEQQAWADKYGTTLSEKTVASQMELVNAQRESKVAMLGLQVSFTEALTPALQVANRQFQRLAEIMGSDKLTKAEKFEKIGNIISRWADKALDAFVAILPKLVERAGEAAPRIAKAFAEGFLNAPAWGQLILGGWLLSKFGGLGAFTGLGTKSGRAFGRGFARGFIVALAAIEAFEAAKVALGESLEDLKGLIQGLGPGRAGGGGAGEGKADALEESVKRGKASMKLWKLIDKGIADDTFEAQQILERRARDHQDDLTKITREGGHKRNEANDRNLDRANEQWEKHGRQVDKTTKTASRQADKNSNRTAQNVVANVDAMVNAAGRGLGQHRDNLNKALKSVNAKTLAFKIETAQNNPGGQSGFARGGPIDQGRPSGDSVPAMLERGEYVLNRNAVSAVGKDRLDMLNFGAARRFQQGGGLQPGISRLAQWANQRYGLTVSSGFRGGSGSLHNTGEAVDLVPPGMAATRGIFGAFRNQLAELFYDPWGGWDSGQMIGAIGDHLDHIHAAILGGGGPAAAGMTQLKQLMLKGPKGPLKDMGQAALDKVWKANKKYLSQHSGAMHGNIGAGALSTGEFLSLARRAIDVTGANNFSAQGLLTLAMAESSLIPSSINNWDSNAAAGNPSGGLMHLTQSNMRTYAEPGLGSNMFDPLASIAASINYQIARYGGQVTHSPYMLGGMVGMAKGGDPGKEQKFTGHSQKAEKRWKHLRKALPRMAKRIAKTDERLSIAQTMAGLATSPGGSELGGGEKKEQLRILDNLMGQLHVQARLAREGVRVSKAIKKPSGNFREALLEMVGLTGKGGRIFDTSVARSELRATPLAGMAGISIADLLRIRDASQLGLLNNLPTFHGGGTVGGPVGKPQPIMAKGGEVVSPGGDSYFDIYIGGEKIAEHVRAELRGANRQTNLHARAGVAPR